MTGIAVIGMLLILVLLGGAAVSPTFFMRRAGWLGLPFGVTLAYFAMFQTIGMFETVGMGLGRYLDLLPIVYGMTVAGVMAYRLPRPDSWIAVAAALPITYALSFVFPTGGADNPLGLLLAACAAAFVLAALLSGALDLLRHRASLKVVPNG